ncbi:hypothetical protein [Rossellomorea marisflavi]|uniref:hypothetical protein n=1 Tax=Rossellomorea marisflavi TaxID=189381 RepID=UPI00345CB345
MKEIKQKGNRFYVYNYRQMRSFPIKKAEALQLIENGEGYLVDNFITDPTPETIIEPAKQSAEVNNVVSFSDRFEAKKEKEEFDQAAEHFKTNILPNMSTEELFKLSELSKDKEKFVEEMMRITLRISLDTAISN